MSDEIVVLNKKEISLIRQEPKGCVLACIAMIVGRELSEITKMFEEVLQMKLTDGVSTTELLVLLNLLGVIYIHYNPARMFWGRMYLVTVPSKNFPTVSHVIIVDYRDVEKGAIIYDPSDLEVYTKEDFESGKVGYSEVIEIVGHENE